jgi:hypothetical protein
MFDRTKIDEVVLSPDGEMVLLYIFERDGWSGSDEQLVSLQHKIHTYVRFAAEGQLEETCPETAGLPWRIVIESSTGPPDPRTAEMIQHLAGPVSAYGGDLTATEGSPENPSGED